MASVVGVRLAARIATHSGVFALDLEQALLAYEFYSWAARASMSEQGLPQDH